MDTWLKYFDTAGKPGGNGENKPQSKVSEETDLLDSLERRLPIMKKIYLFSFMVMFSLAIWANAWAAPFAYISNNLSNNVSVIDTATNTVIGSPIPVGTSPISVAVNPAGTRIYVANHAA